MPEPKVLLVDDTAEHRDILRTVLEAQHYQVLEAEDGKAGFETACRELPDVIVMDCNMPVMNGWQACRLVRNTDKTSKIPIIMCTSQDTMGDIEKSLAAGATDYISKPVDHMRLLGKVKKALAGFRQGAP